MWDDISGTQCMHRFYSIHSDSCPSGNTRGVSCNRWQVDSYRAMLFFPPDFLIVPQPASRNVLVFGAQHSVLRICMHARTYLWKQSNYSSIPQVVRAGNSPQTSTVMCACVAIPKFTVVKYVYFGILEPGTYHERRDMRKQTSRKQIRCQITRVVSHLPNRNETEMYKCMVDTNLTCTIDAFGDLIEAAPVVVN